MKIRPREQKKEWAEKVCLIDFLHDLDWLQIDTCCCVCNNYHETRDHIFLRCTYAEQIWRIVIRRLGYRPILFHTWEALLTWIGLKVSHCPSTLRKVTAQAVIYRLWRERNNRLHNGTQIPPEVSFQGILARKHRRTFKNLMNIWLTYE
uniref:Reverse transcriptase zinc-binding domain-containing protein n=1 Tax=Brassica oleracea var. oleracea TaxID=109376 RepID=A0A0D3AK75_BRAOL